MLLQVTYQIGTDIVGQPIFRTHYISTLKNKGKEVLIVSGKTHR